MKKTFNRILMAFSLLLMGIIMVGCGGTTGTDKNYTYTTPQTDSLQLTEDYAGKDFVEDGIGVATIAQYVDGDTAIFKTLKGHRITVRFEGINCPESTYKVEPWGFAASAYTKDKLKNATTIVLQAESLTNRMDSTGNRYMSWVWVDGRLLNLELCELAYAYVKTAGQYVSYFNKVVSPLTKAKVRIYGETDPDYDYSTDAKLVTLSEIKKQYGTEEASKQELGKGTKVKITGTVVRANGTFSVYLQQYDAEEDRYYGIYVYGGYAQNTKLEVGNTVIVEGTIGYYYGCLQLASVTAATTTVKSFGNGDSFHYEEITNLSLLSVSNSDHTKMIGSLIKITTPLTIDGYTDADQTNAITLKAYYMDGNDKKRIDIRIDQNISLKDEDGNRITSGAYFEGKTLNSLIAIVGYYDYDTSDGLYNGYIQLLLTRMTDIEFAE